MTPRVLTSEQRAQFAVDALHDYVGRALEFAERVAQAAQRGETAVVDQYLKSLRGLRAEAERHGWIQGEDA